MGCPQLVDAAEKYIHHYFGKVSQSDEFVSLSFDELIDIIRSDELNVPTEESIFEACMKWIKWTDSRASMLPQVLAKVRLPLLSPQYLADRVATEDLIRTSHQCRDLLDEARDYHLMPERRALVQSFRTRRRCCDFIIGQIYAVGGLTKNGDSVSTVEIYDPTKKEWTMGEAMSMLRFVYIYFIYFGTNVFLGFKIQNLEPKFKLHFWARNFEHGLFSTCKYV